MRYALIGYGKMGRAIDEQAAARGHERRAVVGSAGALDVAELDGAEIAFEFSEPDAAAGNVERLIDAGVAVVCGTTGWQPDAGLLERARQARRGVVLAPNFSLGVNLFYRLVREAGQMLGRVGDYDPFVFEAHHRHKRDAPSGTGRRLAQILSETSVGSGNAEAIQLSSVRAGSEPGLHEVGFDGPADRITLEHRARGREGFALGAVRAGEWVVGLDGLQDFDTLIQRFLIEGGEQR